MRNIVITDGYTLNPGDLSWEPLKEFGEIKIYDRTPSELLYNRIKDAEIIIVNKQIINKQLLDTLPNLKCICVSATGVNNVDLQAAKEKNIKVSNVAGYSTTSVAQHVFAMILELTNKVALHNESVSNGDWSACEDFSYTLGSIYELSELSLGIYGFGRIGQEVAKIGLAFGLKVFAHHKHPERDKMKGVEFKSLEDLFQLCNIVTLHAPLNSKNHQIINSSVLNLMPKPAFIINTGRGGLIHEDDLKAALLAKILDGAALDVLSVEPPPHDHPLLSLDNCLVTPHVAWASQSSRQRLLNELVLNIKAYLVGEDRNLV